MHNQQRGHSKYKSPYLWHIVGSSCSAVVHLVKGPIVRQHQSRWHRVRQTGEHGLQVGAQPCSGGGVFEVGVADLAATVLASENLSFQHPQQQVGGHGLNERRRALGHLAEHRQQQVALLLVQSCDSFQQLLGAQ